MADTNLKDLLTAAREKTQDETPKARQYTFIVPEYLAEDPEDDLGLILLGEKELPMGYSIGRLVLEEYLASNVADLLQPDWRDRLQDELEQEQGKHIGIDVGPMASQALDEEVESIHQQLNADGTAQFVTGNLETLRKVIEALEGNHGRLRASQIGIAIKLEMQ